MKMPFIDDDGIDGSSFVWTIQNFNYCRSTIESPSFILEPFAGVRWRLRLCPNVLHPTKCSDTQNTAAFGLFLSLDSGFFNRRVNFALSVRTTRGKFKKVGDLENYIISIKEAKGHPEFMKQEELQEKGGETYIDNDTLTLRCRIWYVSGRLIAPGECYARTIINVEKTSYIWPLEKFCQNKSSDEITQKQPISSETLSLVAMKLIYYSGDTFSGDRINLEIEQTDKTKKCFITFDLSVLEAGGKVIHSMHDEHCFEASEDSQVLTIPYIPLSKIFDCKKPYLRCALAISSGTSYSWVERVENCKIDDQQTDFNLKKDLDLSDSLKDDLQRFHSDGTFSDLTIRTPTKDFPVHKAILCSRSTVFRAMFEQDMQENRTGVINIDDVDADTVQKMLLFAYTDTVEDLDCDVSAKLYFAADKYRIMALRRKCSDFLKENLSVANICEVLVLASMHQDEDLKTFAQDFFVQHAAEVIRSAEWKKFMQDQVHLASDMMHMLCLQNSRI